MHHKRRLQTRILQESPTSLDAREIHKVGNLSFAAGLLGSSEFQKSRREFLRRAMLVGAGLGLGWGLSIALSGPGLPSVWASDSEASSYVVFLDGGIAYARSALDGSTVSSGPDVALVIQNAMNASTVGGKILIKKGVYSLMQISGEDWTTVLSIEPDWHDGFVIDRKDNVVFENLSITTTRSGTPIHEKAAIRFTGAKDGVVSNCRLKHGYGVRTEGYPYGTWTTRSSERIKVIACYLDDCQHNNVAFEPNTRDSLARDCYAYSTRTNADTENLMDFADGAGVQNLNNQFINNDVIGGYRGIAASAGWSIARYAGAILDNVLISGNRVTNQVKNNIWVSFWAKGKVLGNSCSFASQQTPGSWYDNISVDETVGVDVVGNSCKNGDNCIDLYGTAAAKVNNVRVMNNVCQAGNTGIITYGVQDVSTIVIEANDVKGAITKYSGDLGLVIRDPDFTAIVAGQDGGNTRAAGDVVVYAKTANKWKTTTTPNYIGVMGVLLNAVGPWSAGPVVTDGRAIVNIATDVSTGDLLATSTTAGQAQKLDKYTPRRAGSIFGTASAAGSARGSTTATIHPVR
jgi:hypothetical protein